MQENTRIIQCSEERMLPVALTGEECDQRCRLLSEQYEKYEQKEREKKEITKTLNDELKAIRADMTELNQQVLTSTEMRFVNCTVMHDYRKRQVEFYRDDTGETIEVRAMTRAEFSRAMQTSFEDNEPQND